jgi:hypothetical protein
MINISSNCKNEYFISNIIVPKFTLAEYLPL